MIENEVVFRERNERVSEGLNNLQKLAKSEDLDSLVADLDMPLQFFCECSDENCRKRVTLRPSRYSEIHASRDVFIVLPGHEVASIERIISQESDFVVVEKHSNPPETATKLKPTPVDNT